MMVVHMLLVIHDDFLRNDTDDTDGNTKHGKGDYQCL
jgi:hypothetical protein